MKKKIAFLSVLLCFLCYSPIAQTPEIDSLKKEIATLPDDSTKVEALLALSKQYFSESPEEAIAHATHAIELAEKINYPKGVAYAYKNIGIVHYKRDEYIETLSAWDESLRIFKSIGDKKGQSNILTNMGSVYYNQGDEAKSLELDLQSLKLAEEIGDTLRIITSSNNIGVVYSTKKITYDKALKYYQKALPLSIAIKDNYSIGASYAGIGEIYFLKGSEYDSTALYYFLESAKAYEDADVAYPLNFIGKIYAREKDYASAISYHKQAYELADKLDAKLYMAQSLIGLGAVYAKKGDVKLSIATYTQARDLAIELNALLELKQAYEGLALGYAELPDYGNAFKYQTLLIGVKDSLYNIDTDKKLQGLQFHFDIEKKQDEVNLLTKDKEIQDQEIALQKLARNGFMGGLGVALLFAGVFFTQRNRISKEKKRSDELLLNILPEETAEELKATGTAKTKSFESVSVLFTDFKNFTQASEKLSPDELVQEINSCFSEFDKIVTKHDIEKIKTIGDAYMCAGGLPVANSTHAQDLVKAGLEMQQFIEKNKQERLAKGQPFFELRLGIHTGPVVAGVVGTKKFAYDIWGDTVNTASRMESSGEVGKVNISGATYELVKDKFKCMHRGKVQAKNKGEIDMYFVEQSV